MAAVGNRADNHDDHVLAALQVRIPPREQPCAIEAPAAPYLVGIGKGGRDPVSMRGEKIRMTIGNMPLALGRELNLTLQVRTREARHPDFLPRIKLLPPAGLAHAPATVRSSMRRVGESVPALNSRSSAATSR